jgi:mannan endo-1,4-beta-mannosidase
VRLTSRFPRRLRVPAAFAAAALFALTLGATPSPAATGPATTSAGVVSYLTSITGNHTVSGQHNREPNSSPAQWTDKVHDITGVYPGMWEGDFLYSADDIANRQTMVDEAEAEWAAGSLVGLMWHECPPTMAEPCSWSDVESKLTSDQWTQLVTDGTSLNTAWKSELDRIVPYLQQLKNAGVPVLWRPLHEINDSWSWWGGNADSARLYQITHDYLVGTKGLTNLVWVWSVKDDSTSTVAGYYPGSQYVDVVGLDSWNANFPSTSWYQTMQSIAAGKPIALAEVGALPTPAELTAQPKWAYFSDWAEYLTNSNSDDAIKATYYDYQVLHRGDITLPAGIRAGAASGAGSRAASGAASG